MFSTKKRIVIVGGTSTIAEHCARLWVQEAAVDLTLVGRDKTRMDRVAADLRVRSRESVIRVREANLVDPSAIDKLVDDILAAGPIDIVLIAHGSLPEQPICQRELARAYEALNVNAISPALFAEKFAGYMEKVNHGTLAIIGSVAGDRGRKSNYVYGAAKGLVARYAQGLQHRLAGTGVKVVLIKPGPTDTPMTASIKAQGGSLARPENVAREIVGGIKKAKTVVYAPAKWALIMMVIRHLPRVVFDRLNI